MAKFVILEVEGFGPKSPTVPTRINVDYIVDYRKGHSSEQDPCTIVNVKRGDRMQEYKVMEPVSIVDAKIGYH